MENQIEHPAGVPNPPEPPPGRPRHAPRTGAARQGASGQTASSSRRRPAVPERPGRRPRTPFGWFARIIAGGLAIPLDLALLGLLGAATIVYVTLPDLPDVDALMEVRFEEPLRVYTAQGSLMAEFGVKRRRAVEFNDIPPQLIEAFIATEDSRFFEHGGIDPIGLVRATVDVARTGTASQGGSTITMQVARNFFLTREKTIRRKLSELLLAMQVEKQLSKEQIMELYLNKIFFGHRAYGISAAAELYYNKPLDELTLPESAMLAGLPKAPSSNNPLINPERAKERRNYILKRMRGFGYITEEDYLAAVATPVTATGYVAPIEFEADYVAEMVRQAMVERFGEEQAYSLGLQVTTTVDETWQAAADQALRDALMAYNARHGYHGPEDQLPNADRMTAAELDEYLAERPQVPGLPVGVVIAADSGQATVYLGEGRTRDLTRSQVSGARRYRNPNWRGPRPRKVTDAVAVGDVVRLRETKPDNWVLSQVPTVGGALVSISPQDGAIKALSGGYAFRWSKFNRVVDAERQPGSSFKPFVYAAALEKGYTPASLVKDQPFRRGSWAPKNADGKYMGTIRIRLALTKSRNLAIINLIDRMGVDHVRDFIPRFGFDKDDIPPDLSLALGTGVFTPLEMAEGMAVFANGGYHVEPYFIKRIEDAEGNLLFEADPPRACGGCWYKYKGKEEQPQTFALGEKDDPLAEQAIDPRIAYNIRSMMQDVITSGTGRRALSLKRPDLAGKTGTTNDARDSWFVGYQPEVVTIAWVGMDNNRPLGRGEWGGTAALGMWIDFMKVALQDLPEAEVIVPDRMVAMRVTSAGRPTKSKSGILEYIREEYQAQLNGPDPVRYAGGGGGGGGSSSRARPKPRRTAPRVMDELF